MKDSASIEIDPVGPLGTPAMKTCILNYSANGSARELYIMRQRIFEKKF
jgi:hypothetical protein